MRVIGIDPGSRITGIGVVDYSAKTLQAVHYSCVRMTEKNLPIRLGQIYAGVSAVIEEYRPDIMAVEQVFMAKNPQSALTLGHARGSAICAGVNAAVAVEEYSALQIKRAVVGSGNAKKEQVQHMVRVLLGLRATPSSDAADALACAICHCHTFQVAQRIGAAQ